jgi:hypothetical protein
VLDGLRPLHLPHAAVARASDSVVGGVHVALGLPGSAAGQAAQVVRQSFLDGVVAGSLVSAGACLLAATAALIFLPARAAAIEEAVTEPELVAVS